MQRSHLAKAATIVFLSLGSLGIVGGSFFLRKAFSSTTESQIINNPNRYSEIRNQLWASQSEIQHFPHEIPADAKNVRIAYSPGVAQASSFFQARVKKSPEQIQNLLTQYRKLAKYKYLGGDTNDHANFPNGVPTTFFYTGDNAGEAFPPSYEILVFNAQDKGNPGFKWNHGDSYGVAINSSDSEIVYWAEKW
ncbi:hypothetical protein H6G76_21125 [Nostoc sp. FACHB-152]|uniref:hypothetical protein n=1 Tax=unclassified Nostoc TaxID=2593658 RepID=UPI0016888FAB|nr:MULTISPECIES: hypothetical protein [unclassified Nostoc]MBD2449624.1 hypothetical protein [Nostoc sp. FACHB-152]MBD2468991.1 hypothetical protein [Nostoc sp. FACHB-145]